MKLQRFALAIMMLCLALVFILPVKAEAATEGYYTYEIVDGKAIITECNQSISGDITIPSTLGGYPVTAIGSEAFYECSSLISVAMPDSVTSVGSYAFYGCTSLVYISLPDGITEIGFNAFYDCNQLEYNVYSNVKYLGNFKNPYAVLIKAVSKELTSYSIHEKTKMICRDAFNGCNNMTMIVIPDGVTTIDSTAFAFCGGLTSVFISDSVTTISKDAFQDCNNLVITISEGNPVYSSDASGVVFNKDKTKLIFATESITGNYTIPYGVTDIETDAFIYCSGLTSITIPNSVTTIGAAAFMYCDGLQEVAIPDSVTILQDRVFYECNNLSSVIIGNGVKSIPAKSFYSCDSLQAISLGSNLTSIGESAFYKCSSLTSVVVPNGVSVIGVSAFGDCSSLTSITLPSSLITIGSSAFASCSNLESVTIPDGVETIGSSAFYQCEKLETINFPNSLTNVEQEAFWKTAWYSNQPNGLIYLGNILYSHKGDCTQSVEIREGTTVIAATAFMGCDLKQITIPNSVTTIGNNAFMSCDLISVNIPDSVTTIGSGAFNNCKNLETITIPDSVTSIGGSAFTRTAWYNNQPEGMLYIGKIAYKYIGTCPDYVEIREGTTCIAEEAFRWQFDLESILIPDSVTAIGSQAFYDCENLNAIAIPNSVTSIGYRAFYSCSSLTTLTLNNGLIEIDDSAFYNCYNLASVVIPGSVTNIGNTAFGYCNHLRQVIYCGTEEMWNNINIGYNNTYLTDAHLQYHSYEDGKCSYCGVKDSDASAVVLSGISRAKNLSLKDVVFMKATVAFVNADGANADISKEDVLKNGRILFWSEKDTPADGAFTIDNASSVKKLTDAGIYKDGIQEYYAYSHGIAAAEYGDRIFYCTYIVIDGVEYYGDLNQYSVATYANNQFRKTNTKLKNLLAAMLNYGAAAQVQFGYKTNDLVNASLQYWVDQGQLSADAVALTWDSSLLDTPADASAAMATNFAQNNAKRTAASLSLQSMVQPKLTFAYNLVDGKGTQLPSGGSLTFYYWSGADYAALESQGTALTRANATYTLSGKAITENYTDKYGYEYAAYFAGIPAKELGNAMYVAAVFTLADGTEYCSGVTVYSPEVYVANQLKKTTVSENTKDLLKWMTVYGEAAKNYYG